MKNHIPKYIIPRCAMLVGDLTVNETYLSSSLSLGANLIISELDAYSAKELTGY